MKHGLILFFKDVSSIFLLRLKLIIKDRTTLAALISSLAIFAVVIHVLTVSAEEQSAIPIGIVDYDQSNESKALVERAAKAPALKVIEKSEEELHKLLLDEMVNAIFIIEEGYEHRLKRADLDEIISMYYIENNKSASILSDIIAGEMIYPVSFYKSLRRYEGIKFEGKKHTADEYKAYMDELISESGDFDFAFRMIYEKPDRSVNREEPVSNSVLYNQLIIGILGILIAFIAMFIVSGIVREKETGIANRLRISRFGALKLDIGNLGALLFTEGIIALTFSYLIYRQLKVVDFMLFLSSFLLILLNATVLGCVFILIAKMVRSIILYQMLCSILIMIIGGLGFYHLLTGFYEVFTGILLKIIPNSWFIQGFTDIIVYGSRGKIFNEGHRMLLIMATVLLLLILTFDIISRIIGIRFNRMNENNRMEC